MLKINYINKSVNSMLVNYYLCIITSDELSIIYRNLKLNIGYDLAFLAKYQKVIIMM